MAFGDRRKPLNRVGKRAREDRAELDAARPIVKERSRGNCEVRGCRRRAQHLHHIGQRSMTFGADRNDPKNLLHVCWECHDQIHDDEQWARENGYLL